MPTNPYDDLLGADDDEPRKDAPPMGANQPSAEQPRFSSFQPTVNLNDPRFQHAGPEALDVILADLAEFQTRAAAFSRTLSDLRVPDHAVKNKYTRMFLVVDDPHDRGSLRGERNYHELLTEKFEAIIDPMYALAVTHLQTVRDFNQDIDKNYYSLEKTDREVESDISRAVAGINLQRRILADATTNLEILRDALADTERRIKNYINAGGKNNISRSEYELIVREREHVTSGTNHDFDYAFFDINLLDRTALALGVYLKETSNQYLSKLSKAMG